MSENATQPSRTEHALLVLLGQYAQHLGLIQALMAVPLHQKTYIHSPQTKVLEFLVAVLAGLPHLEDISRDGRPLDQDQARRPGLAASRLGRLQRRRTDPAGADPDRSRGHWPGADLRSAGR